MKKCGCGIVVAGNARVCPNCGKRFTHPFVKVLAVICGVVMIVGFISTTVGSSRPSPNTSVPAAAKTNVQSTPDQLAKAKQCRAIIKSDSHIKQYEWTGNYMNAEIGPNFERANYGTREALNNLLLCIATDGRMDNSITYIDYLDWRTHQSVGHWSSSMGLEFENH